VSSHSDLAQVFRFATFELNTVSRELRKNGFRVRIQDQPYRLLAMLITRPGELVTREELRKGLWPDTYVEFDTALNSTVKRLRDALNDSADNPRLIETVGSLGYRFIYPVESVNLGNGGADAITKYRGLSPQPSLPMVAATGNASTSKNVLAGTAASILVAVVLTIWAVRSPREQSASIRSIAVLPLESLSGDPSQAYFADGLTDQLITDLSQISRRRVISRTSVMQYKGTRKPLSQITRELNVDAVVEGTILKSGNQVRITAQLIQSAPERHLWAQTYVGDLSDVLTLQQRVSGDIANRIRSNLSPQEEAKPKQIRPINPDAYDAYLRGLYLQNQQSGEALEKAVTYYEDALRKDPNYTLAYVGLAHTYSELSYRDVLSPRAANAKAKIASLNAFKLDPNLAETRTALASIEHDAFEWEAAKTEKELRTAIELNPNYAPAHDRLSMLLQEQGRSEDAIQEAERALELDPLSINVGTHLADAYYFTRQYKQAIVQRKRILELHPTASEPSQNLIIDYLADGDPDQFLVQAQRWLEVCGEALGAEAAARLRSLKPADYHEGLQILIQQAMAQRKTAYASAMWIATLYAEDGNKELALTWLARGYDERDPDIFYMRVEPALDTLRSDPRFQRISALIGVVL
jgi:TolB-like protein/DNA-binding winged helix-turn-helix (wHTH) protein/Tfp pilus assembly protein PilF